MSTIPENFYRTSIKALILNENHEFLLIKEKNGTRDLPGGGLNFGEDIKECLKREIIEEMGLNIVSINNTPSYFITAKHQKGHYIANILYEVKLKNLKFIESDECVEIGFLCVEEAKKLNLLNNVKVFLDIFDKNKNK